MKRAAKPKRVQGPRRMRGWYLRISDMPESLDKEFREASALASMSGGVAFLRIVRATGDLVAAVAAGQRAMPLYAGEPRAKRLDFWVEPMMKSELLEVAAICGINLATLARLILVTKRGKMFDWITRADKVAGEEESVAAGAVAGE